MKFYVYCHYRLDSDTPFYIGKGSKYRINSIQNRNQYWHNIVDKYGYRSEVLYETNDEQEAYLEEAKLIKLFKSQGFCEANISDGGIGSTTGATWQWNDDQKVKHSERLKGRKLSEETKRKISKVLSGKSQHPDVINNRVNKLRGQKRTLESRAKMSEKRKGIIFSDDHKENLSKSAKKPRSDVWKKSRSQNQIGRKLSEETKQKIRESHLRKRDKKPQCDKII